MNKIVYEVRNLTGERGGIFSTREKAEIRAIRLTNKYEKYREKWIVVEIRIDQNENEK